MLVVWQHFVVLGSCEGCLLVMTATILLLLLFFLLLLLHLLVLLKLLPHLHKAGKQGTTVAVKVLPQTFSLRGRVVKARRSKTESC